MPLLLLSDPEVAAHPEGVLMMLICPALVLVLLGCGMWWMIARVRAKGEKLYRFLKDLLQDVRIPDVQAADGGQS